MELLKSIFFELTYNNYVQLLIRLISFIAISAFLIWITDVILSKIYRKKNKQTGIHKDYLLRLTFLGSILIFFVIFSVYTFFLIKSVCINNFRWNDWSFYLELLPQLLIYIALIVLFFINYISFNKIVKR